MAAPTFVSESESAWSNTTSPKTVSITTAIGDVLILYAGSEQGGVTINTPTGGTGLSWTLERSDTQSGSSSWSPAYVWSAVASAVNTGATLSVTRGALTGNWGFNCLRFSGSDGVGASAVSNNAGSAPSLSVTTLAANSAVVAFFTDWNASAAARTWRAINGTTPTSGNGFERTYDTAGGQFTAFGAYWPDAGATGAKATGLTAPSLKWIGVAIEVKGSAGGGVTQNADASLSGATTITPDAATTKPVDGTLNGTAAITPSVVATRPADASLAGAATITPAAASTKPVSGLLTATATITAAAVNTKPVAGSPTTTATISGAATAAKPVDATLTVTATISAAATVGAAAKDFDAAPTFTATVTPTIAAARPASGAVLTTASIAGAANATKPASATLAAAAAISATASVSTSQSAAASIGVAATITVTFESLGQVTIRPDSGDTMRPGTGSTARPGAGATARPGSGLTLRPLAGTTARP